MKKITLKLLISSAVLLSIYLGFSFVETELNPIKFSTGSKVFMLMLMILYTFIQAVKANDDIEESELNQLKSDIREVKDQLNEIISNLN
jgi:hypothetical protein